MDIQHAWKRRETLVKFLSDTLKAQDISEAFGLDGRITLHWTLETVNWTQLSQNMD
jgi:hypothetical protein